MSPLVPTLFRRTAVVMALAGALSPPPAASAQEAGLALEVVGGVAVPTGSFADGTLPGEGAESGASFGVTFALPSEGRRTLYLGFTQHRFACATSGCPEGEPLVATGFNLGIRMDMVQGHRAEPWIGLGLITTRVETGGLGSAYAGVSDFGAGGEGSIGVDVRVGSIMSISPVATYSAVNTGLPTGEELALRYLTAHLRITLSF